MRCVVADFVGVVVVLGRCSVRIGCCVSLLTVDTECSRGNVKVCGGVNDGVAIE